MASTEVAIISAQEFLKSISCDLVTYILSARLGLITRNICSNQIPAVCPSLSKSLSLHHITRCGLRIQKGTKCCPQIGRLHHLGNFIRQRPSTSGADKRGGRPGKAEQPRLCLTVDGWYLHWTMTGRRRQDEEEELGGEEGGRREGEIGGG